MTTWLCSAVLFALLLLSTAAADQECEVCVKFLTRMVKTAGDETVKDQKKLEQFIKDQCQTTASKENRFCYYVGALPESASNIMFELVKPLSWSMPPTKVCQRLKEKDGQICELKYDTPIDWSKIDLTKMKVKELRKILDDWGETCKACSEKSEFVARVKELKPKYVHDDL